MFRKHSPSRFSELHNIWRSKSLDLRTKLQLFESGVCSMAIHGFEAWHLNDSNVKMLRSWTARRLSFITGNSTRSEYLWPSWDLVATLRVRRLRFLGHVLRSDESRMTRQAILTLKKPQPPGCIPMDAPRHRTPQELIPMAEEDKESWNKSWNIEVNAPKLELSV